MSLLRFAVLALSLTLANAAFLRVRADLYCTGGVVTAGVGNTGESVRYSVQSIQELSTNFYFVHLDYSGFDGGGYARQGVKNSANNLVVYASAYANDSPTCGVFTCESGSCYLDVGASHTQGDITCTLLSVQCVDVGA